MKSSYWNKIENFRFDEENIPLVQDEGYDDYTTPDTSRIDPDTSFTIPPDTTEVTLILRLRQKLKQDKTVSLYRYLGLTGDPGFVDLNQFMNRKKWKTGNIELLFLDADKRTGCKDTERKIWQFKYFKKRFEPRRNTTYLH